MGKYNILSFLDKVFKLGSMVEAKIKITALSVLLMYVEQIGELHYCKEGKVA